jgi:hypothetical protein
MVTKSGNAVPQIFDFGFTAKSVDDLDVVQSKILQNSNLTRENDKLSGDLQECQKRLDAVMAAIVPLLDNLLTEPDKEYLYWPDRSVKVAAFEAHLNKLYNGTNNENSN